MIKRDVVGCSNETETVEMDLETVRTDLASVYWLIVPQPDCTWKGLTVCDSGQYIAVVFINLNASLKCTNKYQAQPAEAPEAR